MKYKYLEFYVYSIIESLSTVGVILILTKFLSLIIILELSKYNWSVNLSNFPNEIFNAQSLAIEAASDLSTFFMLLVLTCILTIQLFQALFLHSTHINPKHINNLIKLKLLRFTKSTEKVVTTTIGSLFLAWIIFVYLLFNENTAAGNIIFSLLICIFFTLVLIYDLQREYQSKILID